MALGRIACRNLVDTLQSNRPKQRQKRDQTIMSVFAKRKFSVKVDRGMEIPIGKVKSFYPKRTTTSRSSIQSFVNA